MALSDDATLSLWDRQQREGQTWAQIAEANGLSAESVRKRVRRFRRANGLQPQWTTAPAMAPPEPDDTPQDRDGQLWDLLQAMMSHQGKRAALDTRHPIVTIDKSEEAKPYGAWFPSDLHVGGAGVNHQQMIADMELFRDFANRYGGVGAFPLGDYAEQFSPGVLPSGLLETMENPDMQWELVELLFRRYLMPNLEAAVVGNHDAFAGKAGLSPCVSMLRRLGVRNLGAGGRVWLTVGQQTYKLELRHDFLFKSSLNTTNSQRRLFEMAAGADVVAMGHLHFPDLQFARRGEQDVAFLRASTYKQHDPWAEGKGFQMGYAPPVPDMPMVIFWPDQHRILPFRNFRDALPVLAALRKEAA